MVSGVRYCDQTCYQIQIKTFDPLDTIQQQVPVGLGSSQANRLKSLGSVNMAGLLSYNGVFGFKIDIIQLTCASQIRLAKNRGIFILRTVLRVVSTHFINLSAYHNKN